MSPQFLLKARTKIKENHHLADNNSYIMHVTDPRTFPLIGIGCGLEKMQND